MARPYTMRGTSDQQMVHSGTDSAENKSAAEVSHAGRHTVQLQFARVKMWMVATRKKRGKAITQTICMSLKM